MHSWQLCAVNRPEHSPRPRLTTVSTSRAQEHSKRSQASSRDFFCCLFDFLFYLEAQVFLALEPQRISEKCRNTTGKKEKDRVSTAKMKSVSVGTESDESIIV